MANHLYNWNHSLLTTSNLLLKSCLISCFISLKKKKTPQMAKSFYSLLKTSNLLLTLILYHCSKQQPKKKKNNSYYLHWTFPIILSLLNIPKWLISRSYFTDVYIQRKSLPNIHLIWQICIILSLLNLMAKFLLLSPEHICVHNKNHPQNSPNLPI